MYCEKCDCDEWVRELGRGKGHWVLPWPCVSSPFLPTTTVPATVSVTYIESGRYDFMNIGPALYQGIHMQWAAYTHSQPSEASNCRNAICVI